jgi:hypothetical protein
MNNLATMYVVLERSQDALEMARKALRIMQATMPPSHPRVQTAQRLIYKIEGDIACLTSRR